MDCDIADGGSIPFDSLPLIDGSIRIEERTERKSGEVLPFKALSDIRGNLRLNRSIERIIIPPATYDEPS